MILSNCAICGIKKSKFIKHQEGKRLLGKLGIKTPLSKAPILGDILFWICIKCTKFRSGDKFMPEMHLKRFTYSEGGPFAKNKERIQKLKETGDTGFKDLKRRTFSDKVLRD